MRIEVRVEGDGRESELRSLRDWMRLEPSVRRAAAVSLREGSSEPGHMGAWIDTLELVTGNGWSAASFVVALVTWRRTRPRSPRLVLRRGDTEVSMVEFTDAEIGRLVAVLEEQDERGEPQP